VEEEYKKWLSQLRKGYLELSILLILKNNTILHGIGILNIFKDIGLQINEGTLYPLLNRMEKNGWLTSSWKMPTSGGHPKREYSISEKGEEFLPKLLESYELHNNVLSILKEN
jgi:PadR family transcriptional regulator PadR